MRYYMNDLFGFIDELYRENIRYFANVKEFARKNNILRERVDLLEKENKELSDKVECLGNNNQELLNEKKRLQENFEELKASSDLSMSAELAEIFAEFTVKDEENRDDFRVKIDEFKEKYQFE